MRRLLIVAGLLGVAGCSNFRDMFSAHADVAATAGDLSLSTARLGQILAGPKGAQLNREASEYVANLWTDYALFAQAVARHKLPADSATIAEALWPQVAEMRSAHWWDTLLARRTHLTPAAADSIYNGNDVRLFQHILLRVDPNAVPEERAAARKKAEGFLAKVNSGTDFGTLASQVSEDPGSARDQGFLEAAPRGKWVTAFDSAGWTLAPGAVSRIVETPFGYHIIKRPAASVVHDRLMAWINQGAGVRLDSVYLDSLGLARKVKVASDAPATIRSAVLDMDAYTNSKKTITTYEGGQVTVHDFLPWVRQIPPQYIQQLKAIPDSQLVQFARGVTNSVLLLKQADSAKIGLTPDEWTQLRQAYSGQLDSLRMEMGLSGPDVSDSGTAESERLKVAGLKLEAYFDALLAGKSRLRPIPPTLAVMLRSRMPHRLYDAGIARGLEQGRATRAKADSARAAAGEIPPGTLPPGMTPGAVRPAPGSAPNPDAPTTQPAPGTPAPRK